MELGDKIAELLDKVGKEVAELDIDEKVLEIQLIIKCNKGVTYESVLKNPLK